METLTYLAVGLCTCTRLLPEENSLMMMTGQCAPSMSLTEYHWEIGFSVLFCFALLLPVNPRFLGYPVSDSWPSRQCKAWILSPNVGFKLNQTVWPLLDGESLFLQHI